MRLRVSCFDNMHSITVIPMIVSVMPSTASLRPTLPRLVVCFRDEVAPFKLPEEIVEGCGGNGDTIDF